MTVHAIIIRALTECPRISNEIYGGGAAHTLRFEPAKNGEVRAVTDNKMSYTASAGIGCVYLHTTRMWVSAMTPHRTKSVILSHSFTPNLRTIRDYS